MSREEYKKNIEKICADNLQRNDLYSLALAFTLMAIEATVYINYRS